MAQTMWEGGIRAGSPGTEGTLPVCALELSRMEEAMSRKAGLSSQHQPCSSQSCKNKKKELCIAKPLESAGSQQRLTQPGRTLPRGSPVTKVGGSRTKTPGFSDVSFSQPFFHGKHVIFDCKGPTGTISQADNPCSWGQ